MTVENRAIPSHRTALSAPSRPLWRALFGSFGGTGGDLGQQSLAELDRSELSLCVKLAGKLARFDSADLELIATCIHVEVIEGEQDDDVIAPRVKEIKPKYSVTQIKLALERARVLRTALQTQGPR